MTEVSAQTERILPPFTFLFYSGPPWNGWWPPALVSAIFYIYRLLIQMPISSRKTLTDTPEIMHYHLSGHLSRASLSHKVNHRTLILTNARKRMEAVCLRCVDVEETAEAQTRTLELTGHSGDNGIYQEV